MADDDEQQGEPDAQALVEAADAAGRGADATIDASAFVEELQAEMDAAQEAMSGAAELAHQTSLPPPLPPKKLGRNAIVAIIAVAIVSAVAAVLVSTFMFPDEPEATRQPVDPAAQPVQPEEPAADEEPTTTISLDTVVIGADEGEGDEELEEEAAPAE